jgi:hypothetical protein
MSSSPTPTTRPGSNAGRYLFLFVLGLALGVVGVVMALRALDARKTWQDRYPTAAMQLMQAHMAQLGRSTEANRCAATDTLPHLQALRVLANDIEPSMPGLRDDARFVGHAGKLRATLDSALANPPVNCAGVGTAARQLQDACKACHQDYRG